MTRGSGKAGEVFSWDVSGKHGKIIELALGGLGERFRAGTRPVFLECLKKLSKHHIRIITKSSANMDLALRGLGERFRERPRPVFLRCLRNLTYQQTVTNSLNGPGTGSGRRSFDDVLMPEAYER